MKRRDFITLFGGAVVWQLPAGAQQPAMPVIGYLGSGSPGIYASRLAAFRKGLAETGHTEGRNAGACEKPVQRPPLALLYLRTWANEPSLAGFGSARLNPQSIRKPSIPGRFYGAHRG